MTVLYDPEGVVFHSRGLRPCCSTHVRCRGAAVPSRTPGATIVWADPAAAGCLVPVTWREHFAEADVPEEPGRPSVRFALGQPGDILFVGDWDDRGRDLPWIYRPSTGTAYLFAAWAGPGEAEVSRWTVAILPRRQETP